MNWKKKLQFLRELDAMVSVRTSDGERYLVTVAAEVHSGGFLTSSGGHGKTPAQAVNDMWEFLTSAQYPNYVRARTLTGYRPVRWNPIRQEWTPVRA